MNRILLTILMVLLIALGSPAKADSVIPPGHRRILFPFDYHRVTLQDGLLKRQVDEVKDFYLGIPDDDLLHGFRVRAGRPAPGKELGGMYSSDTWHIFGQIISGLSKLYAATGDTACKDKVNHLVDEWAKCIGPDGYFYYSLHPKFPSYIYDKMLVGLLDAHIYVDTPRALDYCYTITQWAIKNLPQHGTCPVGLGGPVEWYTLTENLYRAYLCTGDPIYKNFGKNWEYPSFWDLFLNKRDIFAEQCEGKPRTYHAYSHVHSLLGAGAAYLVTGEQHYLDTLRNAYDFMQNTECFATGGYGPGESLFAPDALEEKFCKTPASFETQCGSWAAFEMCKYLISCTGDARYGDWIERLVYNAVAASIPNKKTGQTFYYSNYRPGLASKWWTGWQWPCCAGTKSMAVADYYDLIYFKDADGICVNLYTPSTVRFQAGGIPVVLRQETTFPEADKVSFILQPQKPVEFEVKLRKPGWLKERAVCSVNGEAFKLKENDRHWMTIRRTWSPGDRVEIQLPMSLAANRLPSKHLYPFAVTIGPVVLCAKSANDPSAQIDPHNPEKSLIAVPSEPLTYRVENPPNQAPPAVLMPFYKFGPAEKYFMYFSSSPESTGSDGSTEEEGSPKGGGNIGENGGTKEDGGKGSGKPLKQADEAQESWDALEKAFALQGKPGFYVDLPGNKTPVGVWGQAEVILAALDLAELTGNYGSVRKMLNALRAYQCGDGYTPYPPQKPSTDPRSKCFKRFYDDNGEVGEALMQAYAQTGDTTYLNEAKRLYNFVKTGQHPEGGVLEKEGENPATSSMSATGSDTKFALLLYQATKDPVYLKFAEKNYQYMQQYFLVTRKDTGLPEGLYSDNVDTSVQPPKQWGIRTYMQGYVIGINLLFYRITGDQQYLTRATQIAEATLNFFTWGRMWREPPCFSSIFFRNLLALDQVAPKPIYRQTLNDYLKAVWAKARNPQTGLFDQADIGHFGKIVDNSGLVQLFALSKWLPDRLSLIN